MKNTVQGGGTVHPFPAMKPGHRLVPARIGRKGRMQIVYVECPHWCIEDHVENWNSDLEDITHYGDTVEVAVSTMEQDTPLFQWYSRLSSDPVAAEPSLRAAHVLLGDGSPHEARLTPDMVDEFANELISFAAQIRTAARSARLHNAAAVASATEMSEALAQVQGVTA